MSILSFIIKIKAINLFKIIIIILIIVIVIAIFIISQLLLFQNCFLIIII